MKLSNRVQALGESETLAMARLTNELKDRGHDVVNLTLGEPDFPPFDFFKNAAKKAIDENTYRYSPVPGLLDLRQAISSKLKRDNDLDYTAEQIVVSTGAKQAIANLMLSIINKGDEVILPAPYWVTYFELIQFSQGNPQVIFAGSDQDFKITPEQLEEAITEKTKAFLFSNPSNPTGAVYTEGELEALAKVFSKHPHITIISDEIYEHIFFGENIKSLGAFSEIKDQVVIINGLSKAFSVTGWRLGYVAAPIEIAKACQKIQSQFTSGTNVITQKASISALKLDPKEVLATRNESFKTRRDFILKELAEIEGIELGKPQGAFYVFPNIKKLLGKSYKGRILNNSQDFAMTFLEDFYVGTTPGHAFGAEGYLRISYATSMEELKKAVIRLKKFVSILS